MIKFFGEPRIELRRIATSPLRTVALSAGVAGSFTTTALVPGLNIPVEVIATFRSCSRSARETGALGASRFIISEGRIIPSKSSKCPWPSFAPMTSSPRPLNAQAWS